MTTILELFFAERLAQSKSMLPNKIDYDVRPNPPILCVAFLSGKLSLAAHTNWKHPKQFPINYVQLKFRLGLSL